MADITCSLTYTLTSGQKAKASEVMQNFNDLVSHTTLKDEDDFASDSATAAPTQQATKAFIASGTITMSNKTLTSPVLNGDLTGTAILDEDDFASDSATKVPSQQSVGAYVIAKSIGTTKGDVIVFTASGTPVRLGVGSNDQVLTADSGETPGVKWATPSSADVAEDSIARGFELVYNDANSVKVNPGILLHGASKVAKTSITTLTLATAGDWWDGAADSYAGGAGWCYVGVDSSGNVKLLGANPPDKADTSGNTDGTLVYWYDTSLYWRVVGAFRVDTADTVDYVFHQVGNFVFYDDLDDTAALSGGTATSFTDVDVTTFVPSFSQLAMLSSFFQGNNLIVYVRKNGSSGDGFLVHHPGSSFGSEGNGTTLCPLDSSQVFEYKLTGGSLDLWILGYDLSLIR